MAEYKTYSEKLRDPRWRVKSAKIIERDNGKCCDCGTDQNLHVHHCYYIPGNDPWDYDDDLLMTVCQKCHEFRQGREEAAHVYLAKIMRLLGPKMVEKWVWSIMAQAMREGASAAEGE